METIIKVTPSELNMHLLEKIKSFIGNKSNIDVTISLNEFDPLYTDALDSSIQEAESNENLISFTMEKFIAFTPQSKL